MATKRSPSPADIRASPTARPKTDSQSSMDDDPTGAPPLEAPAAAPPASSSTSVSAPDIDAINLESSPQTAEKDRETTPTVEENEEAKGTDEVAEDEEEDPEAGIEKEAGITVDQLQTIKEMYDNRKLFGYSDPADILAPYKAELLDKLILWQGDLTKLRVDCIVNAANKSLLGGGGVDGAIHLAAGPELLSACRKLKGAETGETKLTRGYRLPASHIAHTVGPVFARSKKAESEKLLRSCYRTTLDLCVENGLRTVAFSGISTGVYGYPLIPAAEVACEEVRKYLEGENGSKIDKVIFCVFRQMDLNSYLEVIPAFFPPAPGTALPDDVESAEDAEKAEQGGAATTTAQEQKEQAPAANAEQKEAGGVDVPAEAAPASNAAEPEQAATAASAEQQDVDVRTGNATKASEQA
ncbi:hypothetical protein C6P46_005982 [Rhodotorula mucilaginosa]|uniref:Macro domain-containing protein n=1 Tax=Rhodotorula mucilaginosa TaxID=5537 RepID=A0A9P6W8X9_RHOMI|nr:hypothetical protein C6P46_005982 [Rhodotorula mucilaginosa]